MRRLPSVVLVLALGCQGGVAAGAPCGRNAECSAPLVCRFDRCRVECVTSADCPAGARCLPGGSCSLETDDACGTTRPCASGLLCIAGACQAPCTEASDCAPDAVCTLGTGGLGVCETHAPRDAGPPSEAGVDASDADAGTSGCGGVPCGTALDACPTTDAACAIRSDGSVVCWGRMGPVLGTPTAHPQATPLPIVDASTHTTLVARELACMIFTACALRDDGSVACWGGNTGGTIGQPTSATTVAYEATTVPGLPSGDPVEHLFAGQSSMCARLASGAIWCWGTVPEADLGEISAMRLTRLAGTPALGQAPCVLHADGSVTCWGYDAYGTVGPGAPSPGGIIPASTPITVPLPGPASMLASGTVFVAALVGSDVYTWGSNDSGQLGRPAVLDPAHPCTSCDRVPARASTTGPIDTIWTSWNASATCARQTSGAVECWGTLNGVCWPESTSCTAPTPVPVLAGARRFAATHVAACAVLADGTVGCAGSNALGHLARTGPGTTRIERICIGPGCPGGL